MVIVEEAEVVALVRAYADKVHGMDAVRATLGAKSDLAEFGLDSSDLVCLAAEFEDHFHLPVDPVTFLRHETIRLILLDMDTRGEISFTLPPPGVQPVPS